MRVALVNDLKIAIEALQRALATIPGVEIAWVAEDGLQAVERCRRDVPDLILMDMIMPNMDGAEATRRIMQECPCPILITTVSVKTNIDKVYEALGFGATDAVNTPSFSSRGKLDGVEQLARKIRFVAGVHGQHDRLESRPVAAGRSLRDTAAGRAPLVALGSSTGGPQSLRKILLALPEAPPYPVVVVQHLGEVFVPGLAVWLARETGHQVQVAEHGAMPERGRIYIACSPDHLVLDAKGQFRYQIEPRQCLYRPSVDTLYKSLLDAPMTTGVAALLTGMGQDGAEGLKALRDAGWHTIAQDESTSVVWGMPGTAVRLDAATQVLRDDEIGQAIHRRMTQRLAEIRRA